MQYHNITNLALRIALSYDTGNLPFFFHRFLYSSCMIQISFKFLTFNQDSVSIYHKITHRTWDAILHDIRTVHQDDTDSASDDSNALKLIRDAQKAMVVPGSYLDVFTALMCTQLQIRYEKLTEQERTALKNIMKKSPAYKDSPLSRMKRG